MERLIARLRSLRFRQIVWIVVVAIGCWMLPAFSDRAPLAVFAETLPPDVNYYQLRRTAANVKAFSNQTPSDSYLENAKQSYQNTAEKILKGNFEQLLPNAKTSVDIDESHDKNNPEVVNGIPEQDKGEETSQEVSRP